MQVDKTTVETPEHAPASSSTAVHAKDAEDAANVEVSGQDEDGTFLDSEELGEPFDPLKCLFCRQSVENVEANLDHMLKRHGLFIDEGEKLAVDAETFLCYLNIVITGYLECIYCGIKRNTAEAIRHHMIGKGHCKLDLTNEELPYREFYDLSPPQEESGSVESQVSRRTLHLLGPDEHRPPGSRYRIPRLPRFKPGRDSSLELQTAPVESHAPNDANTEASGTALLTRAERRGRDLTSCLSRVRASDRSSLMHLPAAEQRSILMTNQKQAEKMRREERTLRSRLERKGNRTLMEHFVPDTPGRING